jgi:hypothetical protein
MKIYLDDVRPAPIGYELAKNYNEIIKFLSSHYNDGIIEEISLDHDLGEEDLTGYDVLIWIEEQVFNNNYKPPKIKLHSANPVGMYRMSQVVDSINRRGII